MRKKIFLSLILTILFIMVCGVVLSADRFKGSQCPNCGFYYHFYDYSSASSTQHRRTEKCDSCTHVYGSSLQNHTFGSWTSSGAGTGNTHSRTCSKCGYTQSGNHSYGAWQSISDTHHRRNCTQSGCPSYLSGSHSDSNNDGYCDECSYYMGVTATPATTPTLANTTYTYDGNAHQINITAEGSGGVTYYSKSTDGGSTWGSWSIRVPSLTDVGTIHVKAYVLGDDSHTNSPESDVKTLTITAGTLTGISVTNYSAQYDGDSHGITVNAPEGAVVKYGTTSGTYNLNSSPTWTDWTNGNKTVYYQVTKENYTAVTGSGTVNIAKRELDVSKFDYGPLTKVYDKTTNKPTGFTVTATVSSGVVAGQTVAISHTSAVYNNANVGTNKTISVTGLSLTNTNYKFKSDITSYTVSGAEITKKELDVTKFTYGPLTKVYDNGTTAPTGFGATVTSASGLINGDSATITLTASYNNKNVLNANKINVSNMSISNSNYSLSSNSTSVDATITPKPLDVSKFTSITNTKIYDGTTNAPTGFTLTVSTQSGKYESDVVTASYATAIYNSQYVNTANKITVTGVAINGTDASNYSLSGTTVDISATITPKQLDISKFIYSGSTKVYDGTTAGPNNIEITVTSASGKLNDDVVNASYTSSSYNSKTVSDANTITVNGISISGSGSSNYSLSGTSQNITGTITKKQLTVNKFTYSPTTKVYDGTITAPSGFTATVSTTSGLVNGDTVTASFTNAQYNDANVLSANKITITGLSVSGTSSGNYSLNSTTVEVAATITRAPVTISLNPTSGNVVEHEQITSIITYTGDGEYTVTSSNSSVATASVAGNTLTITGVATGTATISISASEGSNYQATSNTATFNVTVTDANYEVNGHYYTTLTAAVGSISTTSQTTITVLRNNTDNTIVNIENKNIIIDIAGKIVTTEKNGGSSTRFIILRSGSHLTLKDSIGNGKLIFNTENETTFNSYQFYVSGGALTIESGIYIMNAHDNFISNILYDNAATVNIIGGEFYINRINSSSSNAANIYAYAGTGTVNISGGKFEASGNSDAIDNIYNNGATNINITGGNFTSKRYGIYKGSGGSGTVSVSGDTSIASTNNRAIHYAGDSSKLIIGTENGGVDTTTPIIQGKRYGIDASNGFEFYDGIIKGGTAAINGGTAKVTDKQNGYDVVYSSEMIGNTRYETAFLSQAGNYEVNGKKYETLGDAYDSITSNAETTIKVMQSNTDNSEVNIASGRNIVIDTNSLTVTKTGATINNAGTLKLKGTGTITSSTVNTITNSGTLNIDTNATNVANTSSESYSALVNSGTLTSSKGVISGVAKAITNSGTMTISGGTVTAAGSANTNNSYGIEMTAGTATISGSTTISATNSGNGKGTGISVTGGTLNFNNGTLTAKSYGIVNAGTSSTTAIININDGSITAERGVWSTSTTTSDDTTVILDGEINATECGIGNEGNGHITIGENDGSVSTTIPSITSDKYGFYQDNSSGGSLNFYDGIIKGKTLAIVAEGTINTPKYYEVVNSVSGNYKVATLDARKPFITEWTVPANTTIKLPIAESSRNDYCVDWGDGTTEYFTGSAATFPTHTYTTAGTKTIRISGIVNTFGYYSDAAADSKYNSYFANLTAVRQLGEIGTTRYGFAKCTNLTSFTGNSTENTFSRITDMSYMFYNCTGLTSLDLSDYNTSNVTNMSHMFDRCSELTSLDVTKFNTSNVTNMSYIFNNCSKLTQINIDNFNTSNVTNMSYFFNKCTKLISINVSNFDTAKVTDMSYMFAENIMLGEIDLSNFDTSKVENMFSMFYRCYSITALDLSNFDTSKVNNMRSMFNECTNLKNLNISNFDTSNVTTMFRMFITCQSLKHLDLSNFNTAKVTNMTGMFNGDTALKTLVLGKDFDRFCSADMFSNTPNLTAIIAQRTTPITISGSGLGVGANTVLYAPTESSANAYRNATNYSEEFMSSNGIIRVKPILELIGDNYVVVTYGNSYTEQGVKTAGFNMTSADSSGNIAPQYLKDYGYKLVVDSTVNLSKIRKEPYTVTYTLTYKGQSVMSVVRKVKVTGTPDAPTISVVNTSGVVINSGEWSNKPIKITFSPIDDEIGYKYSFDGINWEYYYDAISYSEDTIGKTLYVKALNTIVPTLESGVASFNIKLDTTSPSVGTMKLDKSLNDDGRIKISANGFSDETSGIAKYVWEYKKASDTGYVIGTTDITKSPNSTFEFSVETGTNYIVKVSVYDVAGNKVEYLSTNSGINIIVSDDVAQMNPTIRIKDKENIIKDNINEIKVIPTVIIKSTSAIKTLIFDNTTYNITSETTSIDGQEFTVGTTIGDEYSYEFKPIITSNGVYKITVVDSNGRSATEELVINSFKNIIVNYTVDEHDNNKEIIFTSNEPVKAIRSTPSQYAQQITGDSGAYSTVNRLIITDNELEISVVFEDKNMNESDIITVTITNTSNGVNAGRFIRTVNNTTSNKFISFGNMDVDSAYKLAQEMDGKITIIDYKPTLYYGVSSGQADMFMSRARDVGSALYIMNASSINKYDGKNVTNISNGSGSNSSTYGLQGVGANTEFMSAYVGSPSTNSLTSADAKYKDIINTSGISLYKGLGISNISGEGFVTRSGNNYSTSGTASVSGGTFRVTLINK